MQARFYVGARGQFPQNSALPQHCLTNLKQRHIISTPFCFILMRIRYHVLIKIFYLRTLYRCKKERSVALKIRKKCFTGRFSPRTLLASHDSPQTYSWLEMKHPNPYLTPTRRTHTLLPLGARIPPPFGGGIAHPEIFVSRTAPGARFYKNLKINLRFS